MYGRIILCSQSRKSNGVIAGSTRNPLKETAYTDKGACSLVKGKPQSPPKKTKNSKKHLVLSWKLLKLTPAIK